VLLDEFGDGADQRSRRRRRLNRLLLVLLGMVRPVGAVAAPVGLLDCGPGPEDAGLRGAGHGAHGSPLAHSAAAAAMRGEGAVAGGPSLTAAQPPRLVNQPRSHPAPHPPRQMMASLPPPSLCVSLGPRPAHVRCVYLSFEKCAPLARGDVIFV